MLDRDDVIVTVMLVGASAFLCWCFAWRWTSPAEDAAILFRYVDNLAAGRGVVWNLGEHPVDGATDMGYLFVLAALRWLGFGAETAALMVNAVAYTCIAVALLIFGRLRQLAMSWSLLIVSLFLFSPALVIMSAGFSAVLFAAVVGAALLAIIRLTDKPTLRNAVLAGCLGSVPGVVRPEGYLIVALLFGVAVVLNVPWKWLAAAVAIVAATGLLFLTWRWIYFGYPLPNPYYKKGGGTLHLDGLGSALRFAGTDALLPILALLAAVARLRSSERRRGFAYLGAVMAMLGMWLLLSSEMDFEHRFQFPILVVVLVMVIDLATRQQRSSWLIRPRLRDHRERLVACLLVVGLVIYGFSETAPVAKAEHPQEVVAAVLANSGLHGLSVATTEAGYVCWRSGWNCVDLWGLTNRQIAHHGYLNEAQLHALKPAVVFVHAPTSPLQRSVSASAGAFLPGWTSMTTPLIRYVEHERYVLAAVVAPRLGAGYFVYVRPDENATRALLAGFRHLGPTLRHAYGPPSAGGRYHLPVRD